MSTSYVLRAHADGKLGGPTTADMSFGKRALHLAPLPPLESSALAAHSTKDLTEMPVKLELSPNDCLPPLESPSVAALFAAQRNGDHDMHRRGCKRKREYDEPRKHHLKFLTIPGRPHPYAAEQSYRCGDRVLHAQDPSKAGEVRLAVDNIISVLWDGESVPESVLAGDLIPDLTHPAASFSQSSQLGLLPEDILDNHLGDSPPPLKFSPISTSPDESPTEEFECQFGPLSDADMTIGRLTPTNSSHPHELLLHLSNMSNGMNGSALPSGGTIAPPPLPATNHHLSFPHPFPTNEWASFAELTHHGALPPPPPSLPVGHRSKKRRIDRPMYGFGPIGSKRMKFEPCDDNISLADIVSRARTERGHANGKVKRKRNRIKKEGKHPRMRCKKEGRHPQLPAGLGALDMSSLGNADELLKVHKSPRKKNPMVEQIRRSRSKGEKWTPGTRRGDFYLCASNDTWDSIAQMFNTTAEELISYNATERRTVEKWLAMDLANTRILLVGKRYKHITPTNSGKWQAQLYHKGKMYGLGSYATQEEAAAAYNAKAEELGKKKRLSIQPVG